jgi:protein-disulfide isomerase
VRWLRGGAIRPPTFPAMMAAQPFCGRALGVSLLLLALAACKASPDDASGATSAAVAQTKATPASSASSSDLLARADSGRIRGAPTARVWVVEVSDFQCPYCKMWHDSTYATIVREYVETGKVRMAFVNFPLGNHANAVPAAEAAMCASAQGKFWDVHSAIFDTQERWATLPDAKPVFDSLATSHGVSLTAWRECMSTHAMLPLIQADRDRGSQAGVRSTPSFLIGGDAIAGAQPVETFRAAIEKALRAAPAPR